MRLRKKESLLMLIILIVAFLAIGYAYITTTLSINGTTDVDSNTWNVYWDNIEVATGSITGSQVITPPTINNDKNKVSYHIRFKEPGEYYEFTLNAINAGSIDAMIDKIITKLNNVEVTSLPNYLKYNVTYLNGTELDENHLLAANSSITYKVRIEYSSDVSPNELPSTDQNLSISFGINYIQADENAISVSPNPESFETDSWDTIISAVRNGDTSTYNVGDTKEVDLGTLGIYHLRIVNKSTPAECSSPDFSETACGFVLEFSDIISEQIMNASGENTGSWQDCYVRNYVNSVVYNALPTELKNSIINTRVITGYGHNDTQNFVTNDKLFLLSLRELFFDYELATQYDTAWNNSRQVDYYRALVTSINDYLPLIKKYNNVAADWWTRTPAYYNLPDDFIYVDENGSTTFGDNPDTAKGVSPAFRIG